MMEEVQQIDFAVLNFIYENLRNPFFDKLMPLISLLADNGIIWVAAAIILLLWKKERKNGVTLSIALFIEFILVNIIIKPLVSRVRPYDINDFVELLINPLTDYSFPSGHTAVSFTAAVVLYSINKKWGICAFILSILIGFSRLYLYVHFPSDVLAGIIIGISVGAVVVLLTKLKYYNSVRDWLKHKLFNL